MTDETLVEKVAETLANQIGMRKGCPPIKGCLALMPPHMADIFRDDARAAIDASGLEERERVLAKRVETLEESVVELWHKGSDHYPGLHACLDMTWEEYRVWANPSALSAGVRQNG